MENLNIWSLVIAAIIPTIVGMIYYSKFLAGNAWMSSIGMTEEKLKEGGNMAVMMIISLIMALVLSFFLLGFNNSPGQEGEFDSFGHGAFHGVIISIFIVIPIFIMNGLFERKSWKNMIINIVYWVITLALMGGVLDVMNHWPNEMPV